MIRRYLVKFCALSLIAGLSVLGRPASATLIQVNAQATVDNAFGSAYIPVGTVLSLSLQFDVSGSAPSFPGVTGATGSMTWNDGVARTLTATGLPSLSQLSSSGQYFAGFQATGPTINGYTGDFIGVLFDLGTNPFTSTDAWESLLLGASVSGLGFGATDLGAGFGCGCAQSDVSGRVSRVSVPEPYTLSLLGVGLFGLALTRRRIAGRA
jgi:hypothetical protein